MPAHGRPLLAFLLSYAAAAVEPTPIDITQDAGHVYPETVVDRTFDFRNTDAIPWTIVSITPACSCTVVQPSAKVIAPGAAVPIQVSLAVGRRLDRTATARIEVAIKKGDGSDALYDLFLTAQVQSPVSAPSRIDLGPTDLSTTLHIGKGSHPTPWSALDARVASGAEVLAIGQPVLEGETWGIPLQAHRSDWSGLMFARVDLTCRQGDRALPFHPEVTVAIRLEGPIKATPSALLFAAVQTGGSEKRSALIDAQGIPLAGSTVASSDPRYTATFDQENGRLAVTLNAGDKPGPINGWIDVTAGTQRLRIPVIGSVVAAPTAERPQ